MCPSLRFPCSCCTSSFASPPVLSRCIPNTTPAHTHTHRQVYHHHFGFFHGSSSSRRFGLLRALPPLWAPIPRRLHFRSDVFHSSSQAFIPTYPPRVSFSFRLRHMASTRMRIQIVLTLLAGLRFFPEFAIKNRIPPLSRAGSFSQFGLFSGPNGVGLGARKTYYKTIPPSRLLCSFRVHHHVHLAIYAGLRAGGNQHPVYRRSYRCLYFFFHFQTIAVDLPYIQIHPKLSQSAEPKLLLPTLSFS